MVRVNPTGCLFEIIITLLSHRLKGLNEAFYFPLTYLQMKLWLSHLWERNIREEVMLLYTSLGHFNQ